MIYPKISILIPHLRTHFNDQALRVALDCIAANTTIDYELVIEAVAERRDIYAVCNRMVAKAAADWIVFGNSDVFFAHGWAEPMYEARDPNLIVTNIIVECGVIAASDRNVEMDFGRTPLSFRRTEFEAWVRNDEKPREGIGWYFPSLHHRQTFLDFGGFDLKRGGFPEPLDMDYWDRWTAAGRGIKLARSYCYHLQNYSDEERTKEARHAD